MSPTTHAIAAYAVTLLLLWGYAVTLWLSARRRRTIIRQDNPGTIPGGSDPS